MHFDRHSELPGVIARSPFAFLLESRLLGSHQGGGWPGLVERVVTLAEEAECQWNEPDSGEFLADLGAAMTAGEFLPNSPLLVHAGSRRRRLFACFALDTRRPLPEFVQTARSIHDGMGGVGFSLTGIEDCAEAVRFIQAVDDDTAAHQEGRPRPASCSATVDIDGAAWPAPLLLSGRMRTTNLNVGISDHVMTAAGKGQLDLARRLEEVALSIHRSGQPGIVFTDRIQRIGREVNSPFAANVCGEAPLAADEAGILGSINLVQFVTSDGARGPSLDRARLIAAVGMAVRFLDDMHDLHHHASPRLAANSLATRKIGVGLMGFAHLLPLLGIRYGSQGSIDLAGEIGRIFMDAAREESERLARLRGEFSAWGVNLGFPRRRNATLVAIAGTATLALLVGTTGGLEPILAHVSRHRIMGQQVLALDPVVTLFARCAGLDVSEVRGRLVRGEALASVLGPDQARLLPAATEIPGAEHILVQAAFQRVIDGGISKTVNCPASTTTEEIAAWIRLAHATGCLGLTIYREGSLPDQPVQPFRDGGSR